MQLWTSVGPEAWFCVQEAVGVSGDLLSTDLLLSASWATSMASGLLLLSCISSQGDSLLITLSSSTGLDPWDFSSSSSGTFEVLLHLSSFSELGSDEESMLRLLEFSESLLSERSDVSVLSRLRPPFLSSSSAFLLLFVCLLLFLEESRQKKRPTLSGRTFNTGTKHATSKHFHASWVHRKLNPIDYSSTNQDDVILYLG